jgi:putative ABC transport system permease protein
MSWLSRFANTFRRTRVDAALDEELRFHVEERTRDLVGRGLDPDAAAFQARRELGAPIRHREANRDVKLLPWLDGLLRDVRHSARRLTRAPGYTSAAVSTLALGIGAVTAAFALVNAIVIQPLPYPNADRLVSIHIRGAQAAHGENTGPSSALLYHFRHHAQTIATLAPYSETSANLEGPDDNVQRVNIAYVDPAFFPTLGVRPALGRLFTEEDAKPGFMDMTWPVPVLLSHHLWLQRFGGDPHVVGQTISIGSPRLVVGVMPAGVAFPSPATDIWMLLEYPEARARVGTGLGNRAIARLRPDTKPAAAERELASILPSIQGAYPDATAERLAELQLAPGVVPLEDEIVGTAASTIWLLFGGMAFVLLIACANAANLALVRAVERRGEIALRTALGAEPATVARLLVSEAAIVSSAGVVAGIALAAVSLRAVVAFTPVSFPRLEEVRLDGWVFAFAGALGILATVVCATLPFVTDLARTEVAGALKTFRVSSVRQRTSIYARHILIAVQMALALVLIVGAALMAQSFWRLTRVNPGFDATSVLTVDIGLAHRNAERHEAIFREIVTRIRALPGVRVASAISTLPLDDGVEAYPIAVVGRPIDPDAAPVETRFIMPGYFDAMRTRLVAGIGVAADAHVDAPNPVVISRALAHDLFPNESAIGRQLVRLQGGRPVERLDATGTIRPSPPFTVVGVAADVHDQSLRTAPSAILYIPIRHPPVEQSLVSTDMSLVVRTDVPPLSLAGAVRQVIRDVDDTMSIARVRTLDDIVGRSRAVERFTAVLLLLAALVSLLLGAIGVYGVVAQAVRRREHEAGIRIALGAAPGTLVRTFVRDTAAAVIAGAAAGIILALAATRALRALLFEVSATDLPTLAIAVGLLVAVALVAAFIPARRAARVDPVIALRAE